MTKNQIFRAIKLKKCKIQEDITVEVSEFIKNAKMKNIRSYYEEIITTIEVIIIIKIIKKNYQRSD